MIIRWIERDLILLETYGMTEIWNVIELLFSVSPILGTRIQVGTPDCTRYTDQISARSERNLFRKFFRSPGTLR